MQNLKKWWTGVGSGGVTVKSPEVEDSISQAREQLITRLRDSLGLLNQLDESCFFSRANKEDAIEFAGKVLDNFDEWGNEGVEVLEKYTEIIKRVCIERENPKNMRALMKTLLYNFRDDKFHGDISKVNAQFSKIIADLDSDSDSDSDSGYDSDSGSGSNSGSNSDGVSSGRPSPIPMDLEAPGTPEPEPKAPAEPTAPTAPKAQGAPETPIAPPTAPLITRSAMKKIAVATGLAGIIGVSYLVSRRSANARKAAGEKPVRKTVKVVRKSRGVKGPRSRGVRGPRSRGVRGPRSRRVRGPRSRGVKGPRSRRVKTRR